MKQTYYHVIARKSCPFCIKAVELLEENKLYFHADYYDSEQTIKLNEQKKKYDWNTVPIINKVEVKENGNIETSFIGGFTDLKEYLNSGKAAKNQSEKETGEEITSSTGECGKDSV